MGKNSFTLFETLISIFILSIIIVGFSKSSYFDNLDEEYNLLNNLDNQFTTNKYNVNFKTSTTKIKIVLNEKEEKQISVKLREYKDDKIRLYKYEM